MRRKTIKIMSALFCLGLLLMPRISAAQTLSIIKAEYFIDHDPGQGNGIPVPPDTGGPSGDGEAGFLIEVPLLNTLQTGNHVVYVRMQNSEGQWGKPRSAPLIIPESADPSFKPETGYIAAAQYAIDILPDNGFSNVIDLTKNQFTAEALWQGVDISGLALGMHRMYVRLKRADGVWGPFRCHPLIIVDGEATYSECNILEAEYFIDHDPGVGNAIPLHPLDGNFDQQQEDAWVDNIDISHLPIGNHTVYARMKNNKGVWGPVRSFEYQISLTLGIIVVGTLRDAKTATPIPGATIDFDGQYFAVTDSKGKYQIAGFPLGYHEVHVNVDGYLPYQRTVNIQGLGLLNISLAHETTICGYVRDDMTNQPIPNAQISIGGTTGFTNQKGYYWISNIEEGIFTVIASVKGYKTSKQYNVDIIENMVTSEVNFLLERGLDGEEDFQGTYCQVYLKDSKPDETFIVKLGDPGAGNLGVYTEGKIEFEIDIDRYYGELQDPNDPNMAYLKYPDMLKNNKIISAHLELMMYDIDPEEFNTVEVNGHMNAAIVREDMNNSWKQITVDIPIDVIKFPKMGSDSTPPSPGKNKIVIHIDEEKGYKTRCDWAALTIKGVRPIVFIHGKGSNSLEWSFGDGDGWHNFRGNFTDRGLITDVVDYWPEDNPILAVQRPIELGTCEDWIDNDGDDKNDGNDKTDYYEECHIEIPFGYKICETVCKENLSTCISKNHLKVKEATNEYTIWYSIAEQMSQIKNKYGVKKINIVAHSMGGLVARAYADFASPDENACPSVKKLFMLGTPNWGTILADVSNMTHNRKKTWFDTFMVLDHQLDEWWTPAVQYLTHDHMAKFNLNIQKKEGVEYYTIAGSAGFEKVSIPNPFHWFSDPSTYKYSKGFWKAYWSWKLIFSDLSWKASCPFSTLYPSNSGQENDNLVPVWSTKLPYAPHLETCDFLNHHTLRDNAYVAQLILNVLLNNNEGGETLSRGRLYKEQITSEETSFTSATDIQNSSLTPDEIKTHTFPLPQCEEVFFSLSWPDVNQEIFLSIIDPNSYVIAEDDPNITFAKEKGLIFYSIPNPQSGNWQLLIDGNSITEAVDYSRTTIITGNGLSHNLITDKDFYYQNEPVVITQTLNEWDNPLLDANVTVSITDPNHNVIAVNFFDNGTHGDISAGDGIYTNAENTFNIGGTYYINSLSQGHFSDGTEFSNIDYAYFSVLKAYASIVDNFSERTEDKDADGLFDNLIIIAEIDILKENTYRIAGELYGADDKKITWSKTSVSLMPGLQHIDLSFDGKEIFSSGIDGPYHLKNFTLWPEEEDNKLDEIENAYITEPYTHRQFQRDKITIITENISDKGIDGNTNGKYDFLEINITVDIINEAEYIIDASLTTVDGQPVAGMNRPYYIYPGINMVSIHFLGKQIYSSGQNGPYVLKNLSVSNTNDNFTFNENLYNTTIPYQYTDFDKPGPNPPADLFITPDVKRLDLLWCQGDEDVTGYKIYYGEQNGNYEYVIDANDSLSYQLNDLEGGKKYFIALTAYNEEYTESEFSVEQVAAPQIFEGDTDGDGIPDTWENTYEGMNLFDPNDAILDIDEDGLGNLTEYQNNTNPTISDTDEDGCSDGDEIIWASDPTDGGINYYRDNDGDKYGDPNYSILDCVVPQGYAENCNDCNDIDPDINPEAQELCDNIDNNCDGQLDEGTLKTYYLDVDGDGYGDPNNSLNACSTTSEYVVNSIDCFDSDSNINPMKINMKAPNGTTIENFEYGRNILYSFAPSCKPYSSFELLSDFRKFGFDLSFQYKEKKIGPSQITYWFFNRVSGENVELPKNVNESDNNDLYIIDNIE